jgi:preprotein translocase subunit SecA
MLGGNAEFLARAALRKDGMDEDLITAAIGFADTDDQTVLEARKKYREYYDKYNAEIKEKAVAVKEAGGLYILGTERHESRRIDNQLRGRSGRQGDEGESCFFLSVEDDLMRIFAGDRLERMMSMLKVDETMPIESKSLTKIIESSQKKVEGRNFSIRKNVLNYDDVMNTQREIIYKQRSQVLDGEDLHKDILKMMEDLISSTVNTYLIDDDNHEDWNIVGLKEYFLGWLIDNDDLTFTEEELKSVTKEQITNALIEKCGEIYQAKEEEYGGEILRELERVILLKTVDTKWMAHIDDMEELKKGIGLRSFGQKNPVIEYRYEGFEMFDAMVESIREDTVRALLTVKLQKNEAPEREQVAKPDAPNAGSGDGSFEDEPVRVKKIGDNDPCPCGSGKKYKKCCKAKDMANK